MSKILEWFMPPSAEARRHAEEEYAARMFPLGQAQQRWEEQLLQQCVGTGAAPNEKLFLLLTGREALQLSAQEERRRALKRWRKNLLGSKLSEQEWACILAQAELGGGAASLEQLPTAAAVQARAEQLLAGRQPPFDKGKREKRR